MMARCVKEAYDFIAVHVGMEVHHTSALRVKKQQKQQQWCQQV